MHVRLATSPSARLRGLIGSAPPAAASGLLLSPARSVHTCLMHFPLDLVFLDGDLCVLDVAAQVPPWRLRARRGARAVLELAAGEAQRLRIGAGDRLVVQPCASCCS